jgi:spore coat polysaccharide biosynthesis protein SpsF
MVIPFYRGKGVLELLISKLTSTFPKEVIVLATTNLAIDDELVAIAREFNISFFRGSEINVLERFLNAAEEFKFNNVIRICADNPFLDIHHIHILIQEIEKGDLDYISYKTEDGLPTIKSHLGLYSEAVATSALQKVSTLTSNAFYLEHVTNYIYDHSGQFSLKLMILPQYMKNSQNIRLTLDTLEDFELYQEIYPKLEYKSTEDIVNLIRSNWSIQKRMSEQIKRNKK